MAGDLHTHTTWSDAGTASKWSYLHLDPLELMRPYFPPETLPNAALLQQVVQGHYYILSPRDHPTVAPLVRAVMAEMEQKQMNYQGSVRVPMLVAGPERYVGPAGRTDPALGGIDPTSHTIHPVGYFNGG